MYFIGQFRKAVNYVCRGTMIQNTGNEEPSYRNLPLRSNSKNIKIPFYRWNSERISDAYVVFIPGGTHYPLWNTQQRKCLHGKNDFTDGRDKAIHLE